MKWSPGRMHRSLASHIILRGCRYVVIPICYRVPINCTYKEELEYIQHASTNVCVEESFACHNLCLVFQTHCLLFDFYYATSISLVRPQTNSHISTYQKIVTPSSSSTPMSSSRSSCSCTWKILTSRLQILTETKYLELKVTKRDDESQHTVVSQVCPLKSSWRWRHRGWWLGITQPWERINLE